MKHTQEQINIKAKKILKDLQGKYYNEKNINNLWFENNEELARGENEGKSHPCWIISIHEPVFDTTTFLTISDETGEPLYIQGSMVSLSEIKKDSNGNYITKD